MGQGIKFGAYHFARPENDPVREADWFVNNMRTTSAGCSSRRWTSSAPAGAARASLTNWAKA